jgi:hypothetical protein
LLTSKGRSLTRIWCSKMLGTNAVSVFLAIALLRLLVLVASMANRLINEAEGGRQRL